MYRADTLIFLGYCRLSLHIEIYFLSRELCSDKSFSAFVPLGCFQPVQP